MSRIINFLKAHWVHFLLPIIISAIILPVSQIFNSSSANAVDNGTVVLSSVGPGGGGAIYHPAFNPQDSNNFYLTCDMGSSFVTRDGGKTFQNVLLGRGVSFAEMPRYWFTPHDANTVFATVGNIIYVSYDKGRSWDFMFPSAKDYIGLAHESTTGAAQPQFKKGTLIANPHVLISFLADPSNPNILYTLSSGRSHGYPTIPAEVYRSTDRGETWHVFKTLNDAPHIDAAGNGSKFAIWVDQLQGTSAQMMLYNGELRITTHQGMFRLNEKTGETIWNTRIDTARYTATTSGLGSTTNMVVKDGKMTVYMVKWEGESVSRYINGVYKSTDFGATWELISRNFITDARTLEGRTISQHFTDTWFDGWAITNVTFSHLATSGNKLYVVYRGNDWRTNGIAMTEDEGKTWKIVLIGANKNPRNGFGGYANQFDTIGPIEHLHGNTGWSGISTQGLGVNPSNPDQVLSTNMAAAWFTTNGGDSWSNLASVRTDTGAQPVPAAGTTPFWTTSGIEPAAQHTLAIDPFDNNHRLTGWTDIGIYESFDGGKSWTPKKVSNPYAGNSHAIAFDPHNKGVILAAYTTRQGISVSDIATVNAPNAARAGGLARSADGGKTWTTSVLGDPSGTLLSDPNNSGLPRRSIISNIVHDPKHKNIVYVLASGAGVYKSTDGGITFAPLSHGIALQSSGAYKGISGTMRLSQDGNTLSLTNGGIAYQLDIANQATTWTAIAGPQNAKITRLEMDGNTLYATTALQELSKDPTPFGSSGTRANLGRAGAWASTDNGATWRQIFTDMYQATDIVSDSRNPEILYMSTREGKVYASQKGSKTTLSDWVELDGLDFYAPTHIFEDPTNPKIIYTTTNCGGTWRLNIPFSTSTEQPEDNNNNDNSNQNNNDPTTNPDKPADNNDNTTPDQNTLPSQLPKSGPTSHTLPIIAIATALSLYLYSRRRLQA